MPGDDRHVVVLGAGPGGLAVAHELTAAGRRVTVLERNDFVGGLCRTVEHRGFRFDLGGHRWFTKNMDLDRWFRRLMEGELVRVERRSRIYHDGRFFDYPVSLGNVFRNTSIPTVARIGLDFLASAVKMSMTQREVSNMEEAYTQQFGKTLYEMFFRNYSEKVWGHPCHELSADWVAQRSAGLSVVDVIKDTLLKVNSKHQSLIDEFVYPRLGYMRIAERMTEDIRHGGNEVKLRCAVERVRDSGDGLVVHYRDGHGEERTMAADDVVSTIPLGLLVRMVEPALPNDAIEAARSLEFRDLVTVTLIIETPQVSADTWLYVQDRSVVFGRLHEPRNWSRDMVPGDGYTSLVLECFCSKGDDIWEASDEELVARCVRDLDRKLGFVSPDKVRDAVVVRTTNAYPIYDLHYASKLQCINAALADVPGLHIVGRGGTFRYNNADHSIEMGLLLARRIMGLSVDHLQVNTEQEYHEIRYHETAARDHYVEDYKVGVAGDLEQQ